MVSRWEYYRDLVWVLTERDLKLKYKNHLLGFVWSLLLPFSQALVFYVAFQFIFRVRIENYAFFLLTGLFPWQWFTSGLQVGTMAIVSSAPLIKKTVFPKELVVVTGVLGEALHFLLAQVVLIGLLLAGGVVPAWSWLGLLLLIPLQYLLICGISFGTSALAVFFRDTLWMVNIALNLGFYLTPILYDLDMLPGGWSWLLFLNPMTSFVLLYRKIYLEGIVEWSWLGIAVVYTVVVLVLGFLFFRWLRWRFAEVL